MSLLRTYLDYNATAPLRASARAAMTSAMDLIGNASSVHFEGREARAVLEQAREAVAALLGAERNEIVFTSGGTEANNWVLQAGWDVIFVAPIEHESVLAPARAVGRTVQDDKFASQNQPDQTLSAGKFQPTIKIAQLVELPVDGNGVILVDEAVALMDRYWSTKMSDHAQQSKGDNATKAPKALLSLQLANSETGIIQPMEQIIAAADTRGIYVHTDAVQAAGRLDISFAKLGVQYLTVSGHKIGGPKGVGALLIKAGVGLPRFMVGGGQEQRWRAGTENVAAIGGFGSAAQAALCELPSMGSQSDLRLELERKVQLKSPDIHIIGRDVHRLPNTTCMALPGLAAETLVIKLDLAGIAVSAGSACSSGKVGSSHVLAAMGIAPNIARSAIRVSLGWDTQPDNIEAFLSAWQQITDQSHRNNRAVA